MGRKLVVGKTGVKVHRWALSRSEIRLVYSILITFVCPPSLPVSRPALNICGAEGKRTNKKPRTGAPLMSQW